MKIPHNIAIKIYERLSGFLLAMSSFFKTPKLFSYRGLGLDYSLLNELNRKWFFQLKIQTVIDVGAHHGDFAATLHALLPDAEIHAFEPITDSFVKLQERLATVSRFKAYNCGLGESTGDFTFVLNQSSTSSSFLKTTALQKSSFPTAQEDKTITVKMDRLDNVLAFCQLAEPILLKIDVQGYEKSVLNGGENMAKKAKVIILETSFEPLYESQALFDDIYKLLTGWGFRYIGAIECIRSHTDGRPLQNDSVFIR